MKKKLSEKEVDSIVIGDADDKSKWDDPIKVSARRQAVPKTKKGKLPSNLSSKVAPLRSGIA